jgi:hypothetical protein
MTPRKDVESRETSMVEYLRYEALLGTVWYIARAIYHVESCISPQRPTESIERWPFLFYTYTTTFHNQG